MYLYLKYVFIQNEHKCIPSLLIVQMIGYTVNRGDIIGLFLLSIGQTPLHLEI